jgi:hypothetical protein
MSRAGQKLWREFETSRAGRRLDDDQLDGARAYHKWLYGQVAASQAKWLELDRPLPDEPSVLVRIGTSSFRAVNDAGLPGEPDEDYADTDLLGFDFRPDAA